MFKFIKDKSTVVKSWVLLLVSSNAFATGVIPTPSTDLDPTIGGQDILTVTVSLIKNYAGPLLIYGSALFFIVGAAFGVYFGYRRFQESEDIGKLMTSLVACAIIVSCGFGLFYTGQFVLTNWASAN